MTWRSIGLVAALCGSMIAMAQTEGAPFGQQGRPPQRESADVRALRKTTMLRDTLYLNSEQFDAVYNVYYKEYAAMEQQMSPQGGMPPQGGGGPGGMPPGGGGGMGSQGFGGGMPPQGFDGGTPPQGFDGDMPPMPKELTPEQLQKQQAKRQKKMKKILTAEQYELWLLLDQPPQSPVPSSQPTETGR